ncbi:MAG TPA: MerR family transcriptional regulator [Bacteroidia bacterium]|nr:MerR family transcriptional regulator [Bacteroidia bacterium]
MKQNQNKRAMRLYQITELEQLTGIKAHTIRIWEKRYNLIEPDRTSTNYRRYNDDQVKKLLNVSTLLSNGYKISRIAGFNDKQIHTKVLESQSGPTTDVICGSFVNDLLAAMINYDEVAFEKTYSAVTTRFGLFDAMLNVFYPLLNKIGVLWSINDLNPAQEHFASCLIKRKIIAATDGLPAPRHKKKKFLLLLLPNEWHDISLLFTNYIIRSKGYETIYLGQDVPFENIALVVKQTKPSFLVTFFTIFQDPVGIVENFKKHLPSSKQLKVLVSGNLTMTSHLHEKIKTTTLTQPGDLLKHL